jgi:predicted nucleotidyltransferase
MKTYDEISQILNEHLPVLQKQFGIARLGVFGSVVRGEQGAVSDVDILVDFSRPIGLIQFMQCESRLSALVGARVDLVTRKALKPYIGERILGEVRYVN